MQISEEEQERRRHTMVAHQLVPRAIQDKATLLAMERVPRHRFVPERLIPYAYEDGPLAIGGGQTISQPYIVALMCQEAGLAPTSRLLEIGTGSGYAAAVMAQCAAAVYTIERLPQLAEEARRRFELLGYSNIECGVGDGSLGWEEKAPFDAIVVTAGAPSLPPSLVKQLAPQGRLIIPVGDAFTQELLSITKDEEGHLFERTVEFVRFVPLIGEEGWMGE